MFSSVSLSFVFPLDIRAAIENAFAREESCGFGDEVYSILWIFERNLPKFRLSPLVSSWNCTQNREAQWKLCSGFLTGKLYTLKENLTALAVFDLLDTLLKDQDRSVVSVLRPNSLWDSRILALLLILDSPPSPSRATNHCFGFDVTFPLSHKPQPIRLLKATSDFYR